MPKVRLTCPLDCPDTCSLHITIENGRATKLEGDASHPVTQGFACSKTYRYPERMYLETRPLFPMKRIGARGDGAWQRLTWDEALDEIATRLQTTLETHGASSVLRYNYAGTMGLMEGTHAHALFRALGAIELDETICATAGGAAWEATYGSPKFGTDPEDIEHARLILLWGINSLATNSHLTPFMTKARRNGARIIHIDPYQTKTSLYADEHIRIRPGTDAALALCIGNVVITRGFLDHDFVRNHARGFEEYARAASEWSVERTAEVTGIPSDVIETLALEYAQTTPSFIRTSYGLTRHEGGGNSLRALSLLPILTGQWQHVGGGALLSASGAFRLNRSRVGAAHLIERGVRHVNMNQLGTALEPDGGIHAMFVYNCNPAVVAPDSSRVIAGMKRDDLMLVVLENAMTESAALADYVLPATTFMEHPDLYTAYGHYYLNYNHRALEPLGESRPNSWVFQQLGQRLGITEPTLYWSVDDLAAELLSSDHEWLNGITLERLKTEGYVRLNLPRPFLPYANGSPVTSDGKFHLDPPPAYLEPVDALTPEYPLRLLTPPAHHFLNSTYGNIEKLNALEGGEPVVLVHPADAARFNVTDGSSVTISSAQGRVTRKARVTDAASPGVVIVEGTWWAGKARDGQGINVLTSQRLTDLGAGSTFHNTPVRLDHAH
jgi:anaerobic selenocysteine-containing dehydrogenase